MRKINKKCIFFMGAVLMISMVTSGCEPLRKKFTRKKKQERKEKFIPVLDPIDYPAARVSAVQKYSYHYSLWQVWSKDLLGQIKSDTMDKRKRHLVSQILIQIDEMKRWIPEGHMETLSQAVSEYQRVQKELDKPEMMRNESSIELRLRRTDNFIKNNLNPDLLFEEEPEL